MFSFSTIVMFNTILLFRFVHVLRSLDINIPPMKVIESGIKSLAIHPSETSLIVAAGDKKGNISKTLYTYKFYDINYITIIL